MIGNKIMNFATLRTELLILATLAALTLSAGQAPAAEPDAYPKLKEDAEKLYAAGSYARAHEVYGAINVTNLPSADARWVAFRAADTLWRSQAATQTADSTKFDLARRQLEVLIRDIQREEERDPVWAEVHESLGEFFWTPRHQMNANEAWTHFRQALEWWAAATDIETARQRYLNIIWKIARPPRGENGPFSYGDCGTILPLDVLENALKIAPTENNQAHAHYLIAMTLRQMGGDWEKRQRVPDEFQAALKPAKATDWYDDALYHYAEWMQNNGRVIPLDDGGWTQKPDYVKALELFRRLTKEFKKGETRYFDQAEQQIRQITQPVLDVSAGSVFLPDSEIQFHLHWRNLKHIDLALYRVDLVNDVNFPDPTKGNGYWLQQINLTGREKIRSWAKEVEDKQDYQPGQEDIRLDKKLSLGAYILEAHGGGQNARDLILVTDASVVLKTSGRQALVYFCDSLNGAPVARASVKLWLQYYEGGKPGWTEFSKTTDNDGLTVFDLAARPNQAGIFVAAVLNDRQAFGLGYGSNYRPPQQQWRIYAVTDRPAYRPNETVQWKITARRYDGETYSTPANDTIKFRLDDPRGTLVKEGNLTLNAFGSAWGSLDLTDKMPLGEYRVSFRDADGKNHIGQATLFRLEEYKLPEFKVSVQTPEENGKKKAFRLGENVEVSVQADYYFGGPVANASVEVVVHRNPYYHNWHPPREFPWFYDDASTSARAYYRGPGQIAQRESLKTDATGKAIFKIQSPAHEGQDIEYRIEARVTDASRREITGTDSVRVTRQRYFVDARPAHNLYRPQDNVQIDFKALDANHQPVEAEGLVKLSRDFWYEIWIDPDGREVKGDELRVVRGREKIFPPQPRTPSDRPWRLKFRGYEKDELLSRTVKTDARGDAAFHFTPERPGYYRVTWSSPDKGGPPIRTETTVWVATTSTTELGYQHGGLEILIDKDTFHAGQKAPVMLHVPTNDRYVLFSVEGDDLYSYQLIHLSGTVKLIELPIEEKHVPNIFLSGALVSDQQIFVDTQQVIIPPAANFLNVEVKPDREQYQPREEGTLSVTTRNHEGKPVAAEVTLSLVDESVFYIQEDYAGDPRQFFFGTKRSHRIQTQSTFYQKSYRRLVEGKNKALLDERELRARREAAEDESSERFDRDNFEFASKSKFEANGVARGRNMFFGGAGMEPQLMRRYGLVPRSGSAPMDAMPVTALAAAPEAKAVAGAAGADKLLGLGLEQEPAVQVRSDFRSTILWQPDVTTDADGQATVKLKYPEALTGWKATARAVSKANQLGIANAQTRTKQPLIVRLQAPRFFVVGDTVTISAILNNNTEEEITASAQFEAEGMANPTEPSRSGIKIPARSEARADWTVEPKQAGPVRLKVTARGGQFADAMEKNYLVYEHGLEKFISKSGKVRGDDVTVKLDLPKERKAGATSLTVQITPSLAVTMLDALPYLIDYPYGCTEQTMSRFLPAAITAKTLKDLGLHPEDVMSRVFGGIESQHAAQTQPKGKKDLQKLDDLVKQGLNRLYDFQRADGGWGWWKEGESDHFMSAYVVWGLVLAREAGLDVKQDALARGVRYLDKELVEEETNPDQQAWMLHALAVFHAHSKQTKVGEFQAKAMANLWTNRDKLNAYTRALFALAAHHFGEAQRAKTLIENLENGVKIDSTPDTSVLLRPSTLSSRLSTAPSTAHWGEDGIYWRWSDGGVEATAFALRALLTIDPKHKLVEPVSNWLIKNRRGAQWSNTRDTAVTILALNDYLRQSGELKPNVEYELWVNGESIARKKVTGEDVFDAPSQFQIAPKLIQDKNEIRLVRKSGESPLYFAVNAACFSLEEPVTPVGNEIFVRRQYYKVAERPTLLKGYVFDKQPLDEGGSLQSGERVETVLTIEAKNNYEYLVFEDLKPAGFEAVEVRSGQSLHAQELKSGAVERLLGSVNAFNSTAGKVTPTSRGSAASRDAENFTSLRPQLSTLNPQLSTSSDYTGRTRWVYQELRDRKVALFIDKLPEGVWEIRYSQRAEVPGQFHALPVLGHAMYVPEIRCNGTEIRLAVKDKK